MGQRRMGREICFKCITLLSLSLNIVQIAHQQENNCFDSIEEAKQSCFAIHQVNMEDGFILLRGEHRKPANCDLESNFFITYKNNDNTIFCEGLNSSFGENCQSSSIISINFVNCTFPDFSTSFECLGRWRDGNGNHYIMVENLDTDETRCGIILKNDMGVTVNFSKNSSCTQLRSSYYFEQYTFLPKSGSVAVQQCKFPEWLQGNYRNLVVTDNLLEYNQNGNVPVFSYCLSIENDRILVYSETKCGEPVGYHCFWFKPRSNSMLEFTSTVPTEQTNLSLCEPEGGFSKLPWIAAVIETPVPSSCGITGKYRTPSDIVADDCYEVTVDCSRTNLLKISAYDCHSGTIYDNRLYNCIGSWKENQTFFTYTTRSPDIQSCFISKVVDGRLYLSSTGAHCSRNLHFNSNSSKTIVLQEYGSCRLSTKSKSSTKGNNLRKILSGTNYTDDQIRIGSNDNNLIQNEETGFSYYMEPQNATIRLKINIYIATCMLIFLLIQVFL